MKASSLWQGSDYAYKYMLGRGGRLPLDAKRVKVIELTKEPIPGGQKSRTSVLVAFLDDEGAAITEGYYSNPQHVKAQDIVNFWEEYEEERKEELEEKQRREEQYAREREVRRKEREERDAITAVAWFIYNAAMAMRRWEREKEERERREKVEKHLQRVRNILITRGLQRNEFRVTQTFVEIPLTEMERWLGIESPIE